MFWVNENLWKGATIHYANCPQLLDQERRPGDGAWRGPIQTHSETVSVAFSTNLDDILDCQLCAPFAGIAFGPRHRGIRDTGLAAAAYRAVLEQARQEQLEAEEAARLAAAAYRAAQEQGRQEQQELTAAYWVAREEARLPTPPRQQNGDVAFHPGLGFKGFAQVEAAYRTALERSHRVQQEA